MPDAFVALRVIDLREPHVPSLVGHCERCGIEVWIDRDLTELAERCRVLCVKCASLPRSWGPNPANSAV